MACHALDRLTGRFLARCRAPLGRGRRAGGPLVIVQENCSSSRARYGALLDRLPGISTSVAPLDRLPAPGNGRGVVAREPGRGRRRRSCNALTPARPGAGGGRCVPCGGGGAGLPWLTPLPDGSAQQSFDVTYVRPASRRLRRRPVSSSWSTAGPRTFALHHRGPATAGTRRRAPAPSSSLRTSTAVPRPLGRRARPAWDDGRASGEVILEGPPGGRGLAWLAANRLPSCRFEPDITPRRKRWKKAGP